LPEWLREWVGEGSLKTEFGKWQLKQTIPPKAIVEKILPGGSVRGIFNRKVYHRQQGHFRYFNKTNGKSFVRTWTKTQVGTGWVDFVKFADHIIYSYDASKIQVGDFYMFRKE
jgi:hypothetical protein